MKGENRLHEVDLTAHGCHEALAHTSLSLIGAHTLHTCTHLRMRTHIQYENQVPIWVPSFKTVREGKRILCSHVEMQLFQWAVIKENEVETASTCQEHTNLRFSIW